jgi:hypothetical protein
VVPFVAERPAVPLTEALELGCIGPQDPAVGGLRIAAGGDPAASDPIVAGDVRHSNRLSQLAQSPLVSAHSWGRHRPGGFGAHSQPLQEILHALRAEALPPLGRPIALGVEALGNGRTAQPLGG